MENNTENKKFMTFKEYVMNKGKKKASTTPLGKDKPVVKE
jgi:hypothetical protein